MNSATNKSDRGFTLTELLISMAVGLVVMTGATQLFKTGMDATMVITQRGEMQENVRAALNLIAKDASMAGSGLPSGGLALPYGAGNAGGSVIGVDRTGKAWINNNGYPTYTYAGPPAVVYSNYMFGLIPGATNGMEKGGPTSVPAMTASGVKPDSVTFIYVDYSFPLNQYTVTFPDTTGSSIDLAPPAAPPAGFPAILSPNGIVLGDLILLSNGRGAAMGEVTGIPPGGGSLTFANLDALNINQSGASFGNIKYIDPCFYSAGACAGAGVGTDKSTIAYRVYAVTYFLEVPAAGQTPRLMRQVNSQPAIPVADNIIALQVTYDLCTAALAAGCAGQENPIGAGFSPNQIEKVNISVTGQSMTNYGNKSKSMALVTSVSTRNLTFTNTYK